jgi:hypothetical protein
MSNYNQQPAFQGQQGLYGGQQQGYPGQQQVRGYGDQQLVPQSRSPYCGGQEQSEWVMVLYFPPLTI